MSMEECLDVLVFFISGINNIFIRCRNGEEVIGSSVLNILLDFLHLEVHRLRVKGEKIHDIGDKIMGIVEETVEQCVWVDVRG